MRPIPILKKMRAHHFLLSTLFFLIGFFSGTAQNSLSEQAKVSIITCGIGNEVYSLFGHTAIRINDPARNIDVVYNYGAFDFDTPNFVLKFSKGDLQYFVTAGNFSDFKQQYVYEKRSVVEQVLNLSAAEKEKLFSELNATLFSDKRFYTYKFIDRNCTTMVVEKLNEILGKDFVSKVGNKEETYREILYPYFKNHFYEQLGTSIIFGKKVDEKGTKIFLPIELEQSLDITKLNGAPICVEKNTIIQIEPEQPFSWWNNIFTYLILMILIAAANHKFMALFYFFVIGFIGLLFSIAGLYSLHRELEFNYNILLFNPLLLLLIGFMIAKSSKWIFRTSLAAIGCIVLYTIVMLNKVHFLIVLPLLFVNLILLLRLTKQNKPLKTVEN